MALVKISELPEADLPLVGDEMLEVVQGGENKRVPASSVGFEDAPADGTPYARQDNGWVPAEEAGGLADAPSDGKAYGRQDAA